MTVVEALRRLTRRRHQTSHCGGGGGVDVSGSSNSSRNSNSSNNSASNYSSDNNNTASGQRWSAGELQQQHRQRTTVISSIHQPRADVFHLFDAVLLLSRGGHPVYCGPTSRMVSYFAALGHACPADSNPADYFVDVSSVDARDAHSWRESRARVTALVESFRLGDEEALLQSQRGARPVRGDPAAATGSEPGPTADSNATPCGSVAATNSPSSEGTGAGVYSCNLERHSHCNAVDSNNSDDGDDDAADHADEDDDDDDDDHRLNESYCCVVARASSWPAKPSASDQLVVHGSGWQSYRDASEVKAAAKARRRLQRQGYSMAGPNSGSTSAGRSVGGGGSSSSSSDSGLVYTAPWLKQVFYLTMRFLRQHYRDPGNVAGGLLQAVVLGSVVMCIFWDLGDSQSDIESRTGLLYIAVSMEYYIFMIILIERYITELKVFDRELQDDMYVPSAYLTAHIISSAPLYILQPVVYSLPIYFGCNLRPGLSHLLMFLATNVALSLVINGLAWMSVALSRNFATASLVANMSFTFITLTGGFLVNTHDIPVYVRWVQNISCTSYAWRILMTNEYSHRTFGDCTDKYGDDTAYCDPYDGDSILDTQDVGVDDYEVPWLALVAIGAVYYIFTYSCLHYLRFPVTGAVGMEGGGEAQDEQEPEPEPGPPAKVAAHPEVPEDCRASKVEEGTCEGHGDSSGAAASNDSSIGSTTSVGNGPNNIGGDGRGSDSAHELLLPPGQSEHSATSVSITVSGVSLFVPLPASAARSAARATEGDRCIEVHNSVENPLVAPASTGREANDVEATQPCSVHEDRMRWQQEQASGGRQKIILQSIDAAIQPGRLVALMGGSGSGWFHRRFIPAVRPPISPVSCWLSLLANSWVYICACVRSGGQLGFLELLPHSIFTLLLVSSRSLTSYS